ncbi:MAG TPA: DUF523 domain-containing protein [Patescibacteria group bacterium]|nr:DUF523 domain-containing protein [Patescibacteria group bacterium]
MSRSGNLPMVVSACLAGVACRYNQSAFPCAAVLRRMEAGGVLALCPEVLAGLPTPRPPAEQQGECICTIDGQDVTAAYRLGVEKAMQRVREQKCGEAVLKSYSPTCGSGMVYDGTFSGRLVAGDGLFALRLKQEGIRVYTEAEYEQIK